MSEGAAAEELAESGGHGKLKGLGIVALVAGLVAAAVAVVRRKKD